MVDSTLFSKFISSDKVSLEAKSEAIQFLEDRKQVDELGLALLSLNALSEPDLSTAYDLVRAIGRVGDDSHVHYIIEYDDQYPYGWKPGELGAMINITIESLRLRSSQK